MDFNRIELHLSRTVNVDETLRSESPAGMTPPGDSLSFSLRSFANFHDLMHVGKGAWGLTAK